MFIPKYQMEVFNMKSGKKHIKLFNTKKQMARWIEENFQKYEFLVIKELDPVI